MEKTLDLKMPGVMEMGKKELKEVEGGADPITLAVAGLAIAAAGLWIVAVETVEETGKKIGKALAQED